jgi:hypothetical protein
MLEARYPDIAGGGLSGAPSGLTRLALDGLLRDRSVVTSLELSGEIERQLAEPRCH